MCVVDSAKLSVSEGGSDRAVECPSMNNKDLN